MSIERKIRVADCPYCEKVVPVDRKHRENGQTFNFTICRNCFCVFDNDEVTTRLEYYHDNH